MKPYVGYYTIVQIGHTDARRDELWDYYTNALRRRYDLWKNPHVRKVWIERRIDGKIMGKVLVR